MKLSELKAIARKNKIVGKSIMNKPEFIALLEQKGLLVEKCITIVQNKKSDDARYAYLKLIRRNPKRVIIEDVKTEEVVEYPSLYKAGRALRVNSKKLLVNADKIMDNKYKITVVPVPVTE